MAGQLPGYQSQVDARTLRTQGQVNARANPDAFGIGQGEAMEQVGRDIGNFADNIAIQDRREAEEKSAANAANFSFAEREEALRNEVDENATDYNQLISREYDTAVEDYVAEIENDRERQATRQRLLNKKGTVVDQAVDYQTRVKAKNNENLVNSALGTLQNNITSDPALYEMYLDQGRDVIKNNQSMPAYLKAGATIKWTQDAAKRRFDGMLDRATSPEELDALALELAGEGEKDWRKDFEPQAYEQTLNAIGTRKKQFETQFGSTADSSLAAAKERNDSMSIIPDAELQAVQESVKRAPSLNRYDKAARITRDQQLLKEEMTLPPSEIRARINATNGDPGLSYPDLPQELSGAINTAQSYFSDVDVGYLGGMATKEYGAYLKPNRPKTNAKFAPTFSHKDMDARNMRSEVTSSLALAGESFGQPLVVVKTPSSNLSKDSAGADISTAGMSPADKARLVSNLVDAGFTGIGEYDDYVRADFRTNVPENYGVKEGKTYGGWTYLSPEVAAVLEKKGYKPGIASEQIAREGKVTTASGIDYGRPTGIVDENGKPTSSAVGVAQFTEGTFLNIMKNPTIQAVFKTQLEGKTDAEILELRKDPQISIFAAAALASTNKRTMEAALGRAVNSAELYMAHFLGAGGATAFLSAYKSNPDADAASLLPQAAKANKPVFYDKGQPRTVSQMYDYISQGFSLTPSRVAFEDNQFREKLLKKTEQELKDDPAAHAAKVGSHILTPLDTDGGFSARGAQAKDIAEYYGLSETDMKPFTEDEANYLKKTIDKNDYEATLGIMANIETMGPAMSKAALKQLEVKDPTFSHAGRLYVDGSPDIAGAIMRGRAKMVENPAIKNQLGIEDMGKISQDFAAYTKAALSDLNPTQRQYVQDAATAYWVDNVTSSRSGTGTYNTDDYRKAIQKVLGGGEGRPAMDDVNGNITLIPKGVTGAEVEKAIANMTLLDWVRLSDTGEAPRYADGTIIDPADIKDEVMLRSVGDGTYKVQLADGSFLATFPEIKNPDGTSSGVDTSGRSSKAFLLRLDGKEIRTIVTRPKTGGNITRSEMQQMQMMGPML